MKYNVAIVGATGAVGESMMEILEQRNFPVDTLYPLASSRSTDKEVTFKGKTLSVLDLATFDFSQCDIALFSAGGSVSAEYVPKAIQAGVCVIDNTSHFRYAEKVPLCVPEINAHVLPADHKGVLIANPNCSTIALVLALAPLHKAFGIKHVEVATYQSVSGAGRTAMEELVHSTAATLNFQDYEQKIFKKPIAFNIIPQIDIMQENGYSKEEMKMHWETQKILEDKNIMVNATCVRVPVLIGHGEAVHIECSKNIDLDKALQLLHDTPGITLIPQGDIPTPVEVSGEDNVFVGRVRLHHSDPKRMSFWLVSDNVRKGAALNSVQIAEKLLRVAVH